MTWCNVCGASTPGGVLHRCAVPATAPDMSGLHSPPAPSARYPRLLGVELELTVVPSQVDYGGLGAGLGKDNSILPDTGAVWYRPGEIRTGPSRGDAFAGMVHALWGGLCKNGASSNPTCGLHVHVDARDMTARQTYVLGLLWARVESYVIERTVASERHLERYAAPYWCFPTTAPHAHPGLAGAERRGRYLALNLSSALQAHGTVEFRLWGASLDRDVVLGVTEVASTLVQWATTERRDHGYNAAAVAGLLSRLTPDTASRLESGRLRTTTGLLASTTDGV